MFFKPKYLAFIFGLVVALLIFCILIIGLGFSENSALGVSAIVLLVTITVGYIGIRYFIFKEFETITSLLEKIKQEDYKFIREIRKKGENPLNTIKSEIFDFAQKKQQEIDELKKLETFRREFLADVSHELKTPIFAAQGFVHTLIDGAVDDLKVRDRFLEKSANSLEALNVLVEDLITISQMEIGEIKMQRSSFDIRRLCEMIFEQLEEAAKKRNVRLSIYQYSPRSCYVYADKYRIGQVLTNLVMNAIKYGRENGLVTVSFQVGNDDVLVSVKDNGPGIAPSHLKRIFERFYRIDKSRSRDFGGTGLGLSIVKHILEAHNSKIGVDSKVGQGTSFYFKLKLGRVINENG